MDVEALTPGQVIVLRGRRVTFHEPGHPRRHGSRGPLIDGRSRITYVGPYPDRPGVHVGRHVDGTGKAWEVPFSDGDLVDVGE